MRLLKKKVISERLILFLNFTASILIFIDIGIVFYKSISSKPYEAVINYCENCPKPDVYLIILDDYAGNIELKSTFNYDNSYFLNQISDRQFYVMDSSRSNYDKTPFSITSLLNMKYLSLRDYEYSDKNLNYCYKAISGSTVLRIFQKEGYLFFNNSIFDFPSHPSLINKTFLVSGIDLLKSQTLWGRFKKEILNNLLMEYFTGTEAYKNFIFSDLKNNQLVFQKTIEAVDEESKKPKFCYTHLMMPHFPYYYDSTGEMNDLKKLAPANLMNEQLYLSYLKYANTRVLFLVDYILQKSSRQPIILLLSDHGFRYNLSKEQEQMKYFNLAAIYLPDQKYYGYYPTITNVNQMRLLLNKLFKYNFPLLKDDVVK